MNTKIKIAPPRDGGHILIWILLANRIFKTLGYVHTVVTCAPGRSLGAGPVSQPDNILCRGSSTHRNAYAKW